MIYAVIDTNVLVSAMLNFDSIPGEVINRLLNGAITPLMNDAILAEYKEVLDRPKFNFNQDLVGTVLEELTSKALFVEEDHFDEKYIDPKDIVFYEVTMTAQKENGAYLVTGNIRHYPKQVFIVTPRQMLDIMDETYIPSI